MNDVQVTGPGVNAGQVSSGGVTRDVWNFPVTVNGRAGIATVYALPTVDYQSIVNYLIDELQRGDIGLGGIALLDSNDGPGDDRGDPGDDRGDDDDDDSAVASGGDGDGNEFGDSV